ncbi:MAG TPA: hypothetical protein VGK59_03480 [Ohtaekwangia sp.]
MQTFKIKTHKPDTTYPERHFFILSKGYNAGKPLEKPCPNCFVIFTGDAATHHQIYWICYCLWKAGKYLPLLCGSVIPFIHIGDLRTQVTKAVHAMKFDTGRFTKVVRQLQKLMYTEQQLLAQQALVNQLKAALVGTLLNDSSKNVP